MAVVVVAQLTPTCDLPHPQCHVALGVSVLRLGKVVAARPVVAARQRVRTLLAVQSL